MTLCVGLEFPEVSKDTIAFIYKAKQNTTVLFLNFWALKKKAVRYFETSICTDPTTQHPISLSRPR
jgi:hypothetical protein